MTINVFGGGDSSGPAFPVQRSVRLRSSNSAYFNRTQTTTTNSVKCTFSTWVKRGTLGVLQVVYGGYTGTDADTQLYFDTTNQLKFTSRITNVNGAAFEWAGESAAVFRDTSAWYHIVVSVDTATAQATNNAYYTVYVNGVSQTFTTISGASLVSAATVQNRNTCWNVSGYLNALGRNRANHFDGYLTEVNFIDGQALTPASFGSYNSNGVWQNIKYSGTYGTNGFYLNFQDNSAATAAAIGKDSSGNGNNWTPNGISVTAGVTYDSMTDVPTLTGATNANFATLNPVDNTGVTITNGNLTATTPGTNQACKATMSLPTTGKWYFEVTDVVTGGTNAVGIANVILPTNTSLYLGTGTIYVGMSSNAVFGFAFNFDALTYTIYKNNSVDSSGSITSGITYIPFMQTSSVGGASTAFNFGQRPFTYTPPTGFKSLNTFNLPDSTIPSGATQFAATTYTGTGSSLAISNTINGKSFTPDFVWVKGRSGATDHALYDSVRGTTKQLESNSTGAETTEATGLTAFGSSGFTVGALAQMNTNAATYVGWQWKAGGTAVTNTSGSISSQVSANPSAGFSIVTYTSQASGSATFGHGLGIAPSMIFLKARGSAGGWYVYHSALGGTKFLALQSTGAVTTDPQAWNNVNPSSTVVTVGNGYAGSITLVAYCFAAVPGYSAFGSYTGNASTDGPFIYTGFRPRWIMIKGSSYGTTGWAIFDTSRNTYNVANNLLLAESSGTESNYPEIDILSNGFKIRGTNPTWNNSGGTLIFAAFAESPFKVSLAR